MWTLLVLLYLGHNFQSGSALDLKSGVFVLDHDASLGRVTCAIAAVDEEVVATTHVVGAIWIQVEAVFHAFVGVHVSEGVDAPRHRTDVLFALQWV